MSSSLAGSSSSGKDDMAREDKIQAYKLMQLHKLTVSTSTAMPPLPLLSESSSAPNHPSSSPSDMPQSQCKHDGDDSVPSSWIESWFPWSWRESMKASHWSELMAPNPLFYRFRLQEQSLSAFCIAKVLISFSFGAIMNMVLNVFPEQYALTELLVSLMSLCILLGIVIIAMQLCLYFSVSEHHFFFNGMSLSQRIGFVVSPSEELQSNYLTALSSPRLKRLECLYYLLVNVTISLYSIYLIVVKQTSLDIHRDALPHPGHLQHENMMAALLTPTLLMLVMKRIPFRLAAMSLSINIIVHASLTFIFSLYGSAILFLLMIPFSIFMLSEYHRQCWSSFQFYQRIQILIEERNHSAERNKRNEMRHLLGNVAHDLKTVSTST